MSESTESGNLRAVFDLREAAVEHGKAVAHVEEHPSAAARDELLLTQTVLEEKTIAALDECAEHSDECAEHAAEE